MNRDTFDTLFGGDAPIEEQDELSLFAALGRLARARRPALEYADAVLAEGEHGGPFEVAEPTPMRLAAAEPGVPFPARYRGGPWELVLMRGAQGVPHAVLVAGPGPATVALGELRFQLAPGERVAVPWIDAAPEAVLVIREGETAVRLLREGGN